MNDYMNIINAICKNDAEAVRALLPRYLNVKDKTGWTLLHYACDFGRVEIVRLLLDSGADIEAKNEDGKTPLHFACCNMHTEVVRLLLDRGADINARDNMDGTPLHYTCYVNDDVNEDDYDIETPLLLLDRGADINAKDKYGSTPLHWSCECECRLFDTSELLVSRGADPLVKGNDGKTPFDYDGEIVIDKNGNEVPHREILLQLRTEYLEHINRQALEASEHTAALSSGWEMEM